MSNLYRYLFVDLWVPIWPNLAASVVCFSVAYWRAHVHLARHREELKEHVTTELNKHLGKGDAGDDLPG